MPNERGGRTLREAARTFASKATLARLDEVAERAYANRRFGRSPNTVAELSLWGRVGTARNAPVTDQEKAQLALREGTLKGFLKADLVDGRLIAEGLFEAPRLSTEPEPIGRHMWEFLDPDFRDSSARGEAVIVRAVRVYEPEEFDARPVTERSGFAGRPSHGETIRAEFDRRAAEGLTAPTLAGEAIALRKWFKLTFPGKAPPATGTIETHIRQAYKRSTK